MDIDLIIVGVYLIAVLAIGVWSGRNIGTMREFAVSNRGGLPVRALFATIVATNVGGGNTISLIEQVFTDGIVFPILRVMEGLGLLFIAFFVAPRMKNYLGSAISPGGLAHLFFGRRGEVIAGVAGVFLTIGCVAGQVNMVGLLFHDFLGISSVYGSLIGCGIFILYSAFGGIRAVAITDLIQLIIILVVLPIVAYLVISSVGGVDAVCASIPENHMSLSRIADYPWKYGPLFLLFSMPLFEPVTIQRLLMGRDIGQLKKAFCWSGLTIAIAMVIITCIGLGAVALDAQIAPSSAMSNIIDKVIPIGFKGIVVAALVAVFQSTADSYLNIGGIMLVCDIVSPCLKRSLTDLQMLKYARYATFGLGLFAVLFALTFEGMSPMNIIVSTDGFWFDIVLIPLLVSVMGYKGSIQAFTWTAVVGSFTLMSWLIFGLEKRLGGVGGFFPTMIISLLMFFGVSEYGKRHGVFEREEQARQEKRKRILRDMEKAHSQGEVYLKKDDWIPSK
ncbi:MAG: sodium:solute symporter family protein [Holosporales bacterium]|nr:sodium:solute symporter family protein [Holosporales bacterium]